MMTSNVPTAERFVRALLGSGIAACAFFAPPQASILLVAVGICVALTGLLGFCPACALAGRRLRPRQ
jgi:hypothetical protein